MKIPGITAVHTIITPFCRTVPRPHLDDDPAMAAFEESVARLREEYRVICRLRSDRWQGHVVLSIEKLEGG
jgi:hypothetical protein